MTAREERLAPAFLVLFAALYAVQGVVIAYLFNFNKPYMQAFGLREDVIGTVQTIALLPLVLKFLVGPVSDRYNLLGLGHRKPYILLGLTAQALGLIGLAAIDPCGHLEVFAALAVLAVVGLAFYDACCDGWLVDITPAGQRSRVQGLVWTSRFLASTVMTLVFGFWLERLGGARHGDRLLVACAALSLAPAALALGLREPARGVDAERFTWSALGVMVRPWSLALLAFGTLYGTAGLAVESNLSLYYARSGFGPGGELGTLGATRNLGRVAGAFLLSLAASRKSRRSLLTAGVSALALSIAAQASLQSRAQAGILGFVFGAALGFDDTLFAALAMEASDPRLAASTFALFMAVTNSSVVGDALFARGVVLTGGYRVPILAAAAVALAASLFIGPLSRPSPSTRPEGEDSHDGVAR
jgi:PAT family beta-lactamase induction signal transducer AmpG